MFPQSQTPPRNGTTLDSGAPEGSEPKGTIAIANAIRTNGAMTKFDISNNDLCAAGGKALAEALKGNKVMKELNLAGNRMGMKSSDDWDGADMSGVIAISDAIPTMGALTSLDISSNSLAKGSWNVMRQAYDTGDTTGTFN